MLSLAVVSTQTNRQIQEEERLVDRIGRMVVKEENTCGLEKSPGKRKPLPPQQKQEDDNDDDDLCKNSSRSNDERLEREIMKALYEEKNQLPPFKALLRSSSVTMGRRRPMPSFDSERHLSVQEANKSSWCNLDSVHSRKDVFDDLRQWQKLDSIHSRGSIVAVPMDGGILGGTSRSSNTNNSDMNDSSNCSFASFGESFDGSPSGDDDADKAHLASLLLAREAFTQLQEEPTPRSVLMKQQSMRLKRGASYRGSLSLIRETNLD